MIKEISFLLNGERVSLAVNTAETLLELLRNTLGVKSPKCGCDKGDCGTCTVMINRRTVRSCLVLAVEIDGEEVLTLEGLMEGGLTPLQRSFIEHNSFQCGFCTSGIILSATELLANDPAPDRQAVQEALSGNLCRCTGYGPVIDAITALARQNPGR